MYSGELLKKLRVERGISQKNLAHNITTRNTLSRYETEKKHTFCYFIGIS